MTTKTHEYYVQGKDGKLERKRRSCPRCGEGTFMAEHADRFHCGSCGFTEFKPSKKDKPKEE
ncbi:MAG: 30S ribosomal protein S27ae [Candidatus Odinarchaeota archaeon]